MSVIRTIRPQVQLNRFSSGPPLKQTGPNDEYRGSTARLTTPTLSEAPETKSGLTGKRILFGVATGLALAAGLTGCGPSSPAGPAVTQVVEASTSSSQLTLSPKFLGGMKITGSQTNLDASPTWTGHRIRGTENGSKTDVSIRGGLWDSTRIQGTEQGQESDITIRPHLLGGATARGSYGGGQVNLRLTPRFFGGTRIQGTVAGERVDVTVKPKFLGGYSAEGTGEAPTSIVFSAAQDLQEAE